MSNNSGKIPVIIEKYEREHDLPDLKQTKYLFPNEFTFFDFSQIIRKKLILPESQTISFFFSNGKLYQSTKTMREIYEENKDADGFLYCQYTCENRMG